MDRRSVFFDEWLRSLRAQYQHVVQTEDRVTLPSLTEVMQQVGFSEAELRQLRLDATLRADEVGEEFVPDLAILDEAQLTGAHPAECMCPACAPIDESRFDDDGQSLTPDPDAAAQSSGALYPAAALEPDDAEPMTFADSLEEPQDDLDDEPLLDEGSDSQDEPQPPPQASLLF